MDIITAANTLVENSPQYQLLKEENKKLEKENKKLKNIENNDKQVMYTCLEDLQGENKFYWESMEKLKAENDELKEENKKLKESLTMSK